MGRYLGLKEKEIKLLIDMVKNEFATVKSTHYIGAEFYGSIWKLRDMGLAKVDGVNERSQKIWKLTDFGKRIAVHFMEIEKILEGGFVDGRKKGRD
jgi:hypothetical protein